MTQDTYIIQELTSCQRNRGKFPGDGKVKILKMRLGLRMTAPPPDSLERPTHADPIGAARDLIGEATRLRAENEKLDGALAKPRLGHQAVEDELARLKALPARPPFGPSGLDESTGSRSAPRPS